MIPLVPSAAGRTQKTHATEEDESDTISSKKAAAAAARKRRIFLSFFLHSDGDASEFFVMSERTGAATAVL